MLFLLCLALTQCTELGEIAKLKRVKVEKCLTSCLQGGDRVRERHSEREREKERPPVRSAW